MKNIDEIKQMTKSAQDTKAEAERQIILAEKKLRKHEHQLRIKNAKDVEFFMQEIERAAIKGENIYSISLGEDDEYTKIKVDSIREKLKDFNPTFEKYKEMHCAYNYDGDAIDGTETYYWATRVTFNW